MNKFLLIIAFIFINISLEAKDIVIKLHKTPDQMIDENMRESELDSSSKNSN